MQKDEKREKLSLGEELDADSVFDPLVPSSQSSTTPELQPEVTGPNTPAHFSEDGPVSIAPFDLSLLSIPPSSTVLSPLMEQDNALLGLVLGSPKESARFSCMSRGSISGKGSGHTSSTESPMSVGLSTGLGRGATLTKALKVQMPTPAQFKDKDDGASDEKEMDATTESAQQD